MNSKNKIDSTKLARFLAGKQDIVLSPVRKHSLVSYLVFAILAACLIYIFWR